MKSLLICKGEYRYFFPGIARALHERHGAEVSAVAFASTTAAMLEHTLTFHKVFNLAQWLKGRNADSADSVELLRQFESSSPVRINTMIHADRILRNYEEEDTSRILAGVLQFWRDICEEYEPDVIVGEVACAAEWTGWLVAHSCRIRYLIPYPTSVANRFFFIDKPDGSWQRMEAAFLRSKRSDFSPEGRAAAESFIQNFRAKKIKPPFLEWAQHSPLAPQVLRFTRRVGRIPFRIRTYLADGKFEVGSYHGTPPWRPMQEDVTRLIRHIWSEVLFFAHRADQTKPYVYFPLHVQPEFTTDVRAPFCTNQLALIENISKSVPAGCRVLVKEHPGMKGERSPSFYRQLKKLHNVELLSPRIDSHDLICGAGAIVTITGSSAWEAILYEKPVIAFGPLCYGFCDAVYRCENIAELPGMLSEALERFTPKHEELLSFVAAFLESPYELEWGDPIRQPQVIRRSNCERIADAIAAEVMERRSPRETEALAYG